MPASTKHKGAQLAGAAEPGAWERVDGGRAAHRESAILAALDSLRHGFCVVDARHRIQFCNQRFCELHEVAEVDALGVFIGTVIDKAAEVGAGAASPLRELQVFLRATARGREATALRLYWRGDRVIEVECAPLPGGGWVATYTDVSEPERVAAELVRSEARYRLLADHATDMIVETDLAFVRRYVSPACRYMLGYEPDELIGQHPSQITHPEDFPSLQRTSGRLASGELERAGETYRCRRKDGSWIWVECNMQLARDPASGLPLAIVCSVRDVTERRRREADVERAESEYRALFENAVVGIYRSSADGRQLRANPALVRLNGYESEAEMLAAVNDIAREWYVEPNRRAEFIRQMSEDGRVTDFVSEIYRHGSRERIWVSETAWTVRGPDGEPLWYEGTVLDATDRKRAEAQVAHMASHDALTGLANRTLFRRHLDQAFAQAARHGGSIAILCLDLDRFKAVNDTLGHPAGDALLRAVASRIQGTLRTDDTVARLGGDEFAVLQVGANGPEAAAKLGGRLVEAISRPYSLEGHEVVVSTSVGVAMASSDGSNVEDLLRNADLALYRAKSDGRNLVRFFDAEMDSRVRERRKLELDLREAVERCAFELHYQPVVTLRDKSLAGFEALVRWRHPARGLVQPSEFMALAEEARLIAPIGHWVLQQACSEAARWPSHLRIAVNVSAVQFWTSDVVASVALALDRSGLPARRLELEITETALLKGSEAISATLARLRGMGVRIALDDFGTGYSSLSYLRRFPFDKIKLDRTFVQEIGDPGAAAIVSAVVGLGERLAVTITAEGVETPEQLALVLQAGCDEAQGFLFSHPLPVADAREHIAQRCSI